MADPYETLGVAKSASQDEIRKAYRKAAKESHPDLNPGNPAAEERFKKISAAYDIIGDEDKRKRFDAGEIDESGAERQPERHYYREYAEADPNMRYGRRARGAGAGAGSAWGGDPRSGAWTGGTWTGGAGEGGPGGSDFDYDVFADLFRGRNAEGRMRPQDLRYQLEVSFLDAVNGTQKMVAMPDGKTLDIKIPAGISEGQVLRLKGQGLPGAHGGPPGDAYVEILIHPHSRLRREGSDILSDVNVSLGEALNGASVRVETVDGPVDVKVPKRAKDGATLRLRGKGVPRKGGGRGDQMVTIHIVPPEGADDELADFMAAWEAKHPQNPRGKGDAKS